MTIFSFIFCIHSPFSLHEPDLSYLLPILPQNDFLLLKGDIPVPLHHINPFPSGFHDWYGNPSFPRRPGRKEILSHKKVRIASSSAGRCFTVNPASLQAIRNKFISGAVSSIQNASYSFTFLFPVCRKEMSRRHFQKRPQFHQPAFPIFLRHGSVLPLLPHKVRGLYSSRARR